MKKKPPKPFKRLHASTFPRAVGEKIKMEDGTWVVAKVLVDGSGGGDWRFELEPVRKGERA